MEELVAQPVSSDNYENYRPVPRHETGARLARRLLAGLALTAAFGAAPATAQPAESSDVVQMPAPPHLEIGSEDDAVVASANLARMAPATEQARAMGASWWRTIIYPRDVVKSHWKKYDLAIGEATREGLDVSLTLACNKEHWTDQTFQRYVTAVTQRYDRQGVREYSICNEPNYPKWLDRMPGETLPQTYHELYQAGYAAVKAQAQLDSVDDSVFMFELSSEYHPLQFIKSALACPPTDPEGCAPLRADAVAYHPYSPPTSPAKPCDMAGDIGFACLKRVEDLVKSEYVAGALETPDGQEPKLDLSEFAYQVRTKASLTSHDKHAKSLQLPDWIRRRYYRQDLLIACEDPNVMRVGFYQVESPLPDSKAPWNSALVSSTGKPYGSLRVIHEFKEEHPECVAG